MTGGHISCKQKIDVPYTKYVVQRIFHNRTYPRQPTKSETFCTAGRKSTFNVRQNFISNIRTYPTAGRTCIITYPTTDGTYPIAEHIPRQAIHFPKPANRTHPKSGRTYPTVEHIWRQAEHIPSSRTSRTYPTAGGRHLISYNRKNMSKGRKYPTADEIYPAFHNGYNLFHGKWKLSLTS